MPRVSGVIDPATEPATVSDFLESSADRYLTFERDDWAGLRAATPLTLGAAELAELQGINDEIDLDEVHAKLGH